MFDPQTEQVLLRVSLSRKAQAIVLVYGEVDKAALDKLIAMLVSTRNDWDTLTEDGECQKPDPLGETK